MSFVLSLFLLTSMISLAQDVTEVIVTQKIPGPPLWEIRHQGNTVWLFADISPIPEKFDWDSSYIERIIAGADEFLTKPNLDLDIGATGFFKIRRVSNLQQQRRKQASGTSLDQVIDPASLLTFKKIMDDWEIQHHSIMEYKPMVAASIIYSEVLNKAGMKNSKAVLNKLESIRRKHRIPKTKTEISYNVKEFIVYLEEVKSVPDDFGAPCLEYLMEKMHELPEIRERSELWYQRDISFREFTDKENMCTKFLFGYGDSEWSKTKHTALKKQWYENLDNAIKTNKNTFVVVDMSTFEFPEFYQWIEANGYELKEPR